MTGAILAGGQSRRMGTNKAFIEVGGVPIIERSVGVLKKEFSEVLIIANDPPIYEPFGVRVYSDIIKGAGSLGGIYTALFHCPTELCFVAACDMPFLDPEVIKRLKSAYDGSDAIVPLIGGRLHPMHALYSKKCIRPIEEMISAGDLRITGLFDRIRARKLDEGWFGALPIIRSVENINTKEDLARTLPDNTSAHGAHE